jgi:hypothetical protein
MYYHYHQVTIMHTHKQYRYNLNITTLMMNFLTLSGNVVPLIVTYSGKVNLLLTG